MKDDEVMKEDNLYKDGMNGISDQQALSSSSYVKQLNVRHFITFSLKELIIDLDSGSQSRNSN